MKSRLKKALASFMVMALVLTVAFQDCMLVAYADGEEGGIEPNHFSLIYDDFGRDEQDKPNASVEVTDVAELAGEENRFTFHYSVEEPEVIVFKLNPPENRNVSDAIVEINQGGHNYATWNEEPESPEEPNYHIEVAEDGTFRFTPESEEGFEVWVWWSEFDHFGPYDDFFMIQTNNCNPSRGSITVSDAMTVAGTIEEPNEGSGRKYLFTRGANEAVVLNITPSEEQNIARLLLGYLEVDLENPGADVTYHEENGTYILEISENFIEEHGDNGNFLYIEIDFCGDEGGGIEEGCFRIYYDDFGRDEQDKPNASVEVTEGAEPAGEENKFTFHYSVEEPEVIVFQLNQPENRNVSDAIVEINQGGHIYATWNEEPESPEEPNYHIEVAEDGTFRFTPESEEGFEVWVWWSEFDHFGPYDDFFMIQTNNCNPGRGSITVSEAMTVADTMEEPNEGSGRKYLFTRGANEAVVLNITPSEEQNIARLLLGYLEVDLENPGADVTYHEENGTYILEISENFIEEHGDNGNFLYIEIDFYGDEGGGIEEGCFRINYDDFGRDEQNKPNASVEVTEGAELAGEENKFTFHYSAEEPEVIVFKLNPPENRNVSDAIVEINQGGHNYATWNTGPNYHIEVTEDGTFRYTPESEEGFEVLVRWSEFENPAVNFVGAVERIETTDFAFYGIDADDIKKSLEWQLWYEYFGMLGTHEGIFCGMFGAPVGDNSSVPIAFAEKISLSEKKNDGPILGMDYYEFYIDFSDCDGFDSEKESEYGTTDGKVTGICTLLPSYTDIVVSSTKNNVISYQVVDASLFALEGITLVYCDYDMDGDWPCVSLFGNGAAMVGMTSEGSKQYRFSGHVTQEYSNICEIRNTRENDIGKPGISCNLGIINKQINGFMVDGNEEKGSAAAWGWTNWPLYWTNGTTETNATSFDLYLGNTAFTISSLDKEGIKNVKKVECILKNASKAVLISENSGVFTVELKSAFYSSIPLKITYSDDSVGYITVNLVAIDIQDCYTPGGETSVNIFHGSDEQRVYELGRSGAVISASFYYLNDQSPADGNSRVNMFVTYTFSDGTKTIKTVTPEGSLTTAANQGTNHVDDYILWKTGDTDRKPIKVEVIAVKPDTETDFGGAMIGGGAGVSCVISQ